MTERVARGILSKGRGVIELYAKLNDGREHTLRVLSLDFEGEKIDPAREAARLEKYGRDLIQDLSEKFRLRFAERAPIRITKETVVLLGCEAKGHLEK